MAATTPRFLHLFLSKYAVPAGLAMAGLILAGGNAAWADHGEQKNDRAVRLLTTVPIPGTTANTTGGKMYVFDISWVDQGAEPIISPTARTRWSTSSIPRPIPCCFS